MEIILNGNKEEICDNTSIMNLIKMKKLSPAKVIVEHNKDIITMDKWNSIILKENDSLEVLRFVGGG